MKKNLPVILVVVVVGALAFLGYSLQKNNPTSSKEKIEEIVKEVLANNGKVVFESIINYQEQEKQQSIAKYQQKLSEINDELIKDTTAPFIGNPNGDKVIVAFFDYNCGHCKKTSSIISELLKNRNDIKVIMEELPILGPSSHVATRVALAVNNIDPTKYGAVHSDLMNEKLTSEDVIFNIVKKNDIDVDKVKSMLNSQDIIDMINKNNKLAVDLGIRGTPAFIINGKLYPGALTEEHLTELLAQAN